MQRVMWFSGKSNYLNISKFDRCSHPLCFLCETKHRKCNYTLQFFVFISLMWTSNGITSLRTGFSFIIWNSDGRIVGKLADKIETHKSETQGCFTPFNQRQSRRAGKDSIEIFRVCFQRNIFIFLTVLCKIKTKYSPLSLLCHYHFCLAKHAGGRIYWIYNVSS